jgi:hypothetical protein
MKRFLRKLNNWSLSPIEFNTKIDLTLSGYGLEAIGYGKEIKGEISKPFAHCLSPIAFYYYFHPSWRPKGA